MKVTFPSRTAQSSQERLALSRLRRLLNEPALLRASLIRMNRRCGNTSCHCAKAKRQWHVSWYIGQSQGGRPRMKYVPEELVEEVREWVAHYREARKLLDQLSNACWERLKRYQT